MGQRCFDPERYAAPWGLHQWKWALGPTLSKRAALCVNALAAVPDAVLEKVLADSEHPIDRLASLGAGCTASALWYALENTRPELREMNLGGLALYIAKLQGDRAVPLSLICGDLLRAHEAAPGEGAASVAATEEGNV